LADTVGVEVNLFRRRPMVWVKAGARYVLGLADGHVALEPEAGNWRVVEYRRDSAPTVVASGLPLEWAQGAGEDLVRQRGAEALARTDAPWRGRPASDKQLAALRRLRIPHQPSISRGEASELISAWSATRWSA
jgi:hypothetical protein